MWNICRPFVLQFVMRVHFFLLLLLLYIHLKNVIFRWIFINKKLMDNSIFTCPNVRFSFKTVVTRTHAHKIYLEKKKHIRAEKRFKSETWSILRLKFA